MAKYRWHTPYDWLESASENWSKAVLRRELLNLALKVGSDELQDEYQGEMIKDGFFKALKED